MKITVIKITFLLLSLITCSASYSASFNCENANSNLEKMICSNYTLSRLDDFLSENYKLAMNSVMPTEIKNIIKSSQKTWLNERDQCKDVQCIEDMYSMRIDYIWNRCFEHIPGKIVCNKSFDVLDKINKEKDSETHKTSDEVIKELYVKNSRQVHELGFNPNLLKYGVFIDIGNHVRYCTLGEYLSLMFELPNLKSLGKIDYKGYVGFRIKISGQPYSGFVFRKEGDELYLAGIVSGDEVFEIVTLRDARSVSSLFVNYAGHVIGNNNNIK